MANNHVTEETTVLYKNLSAERALKVLPEVGNGALCATQPIAMNDPFECASTSHAFYSSGRAAIFNSVEVQDIIHVLNTINPEHPVEKSYVQRKQQQFGTQAWNKLLRESLSLRFSVVSFSFKPDIPLLWSHYANSGAGVVIGTKLN